MAVRTEDAGQFPLEPGGTVKRAGDVEARGAFYCDVLGLVAAVDTFFKESGIERGAFWKGSELGPSQDAGLNDGLALFPAGEVGGGGLESGEFLSGLFLAVGMALAKPLGKPGDW